jgi:hypothetical protein
MTAKLLMLMPLLLLGACGDKPSNSDSAKQSAAEAPAPAAIKLQAGKWQATSELVSMDVPGMPPELAKANVGQKTTFENCITAEQAEKPASDFFTNAKNNDCKAQNFTMTGGKLDAKLTCVDRTTPGEMTMTMNGDYTPTSYAATMTMVTSGAPGGGEMKIIAKTQGKRIGECDAKDAGTN